MAIPSPVHGAGCWSKIIASTIGGNGFFGGKEYFGMMGMTLDSKLAIWFNNSIPVTGTGFLKYLKAFLHEDSYMSTSIWGPSDRPSYTQALATSTFV